MRMRRPAPARAKKWVDYDTRLEQLVSSYDQYDDFNDFLSCVGELLSQ